jgi:glutamine synthetase
VSFVEKHGLWTDDQKKSSRELLKEVEARKLDAVRFSFPDQHGILRGKTVAVGALKSALDDGVSLTTTLLAKDTAHRTVFPVFTQGGGFGLDEMQGGGDFVMIADPATFRVLPWAPGNGWVLCDIHFSNGKQVPFATRDLLRNTLRRLAATGCEFLCGLEVEFHLFKLLDPRLQPHNAGQPGDPPEVELLTQGYQYLTETRYDALEPIVALLRRDLIEIGLPLRSYEVEYGPSQVEFTLGALPGMESADAMVLFRTAVKQIARRHGHHATFMCRPRIPNVMSSGWHLHQSLTKDGANAFVPGAEGAQLSPTGMNYLGGLLAHAPGCAALSTPTINGYRRYRPYSLAPDRAIWGRDNRGVMLRVLGGPGDPATRIENRAGEPAANPYLYFASQILAGLDGLKGKLDPGPSADVPYETKAPLLPASLGDALKALRADPCLQEGLGKGFVDYYCRIKEAEIARFNLEVTEWEQREYFEMY